MTNRTSQVAATASNATAYSLPVTAQLVAEENNHEEHEEREGKRKKGTVHR